MSISRQLFEGRRVRLAAPDPERDADIEAGWTLDVEYGWLTSLEPIRPQSPEQIREKYTAAEKAADKEFLFAIRSQADDRLLGWVSWSRLIWNHGSGRLALAIGAPGDRGQGFGSEALSLALGFGFGELNLHQITAMAPAYNERGLAFLERHGFQKEVRQRQALTRFGKSWDLIWLGLLETDWGGIVEEARS